MLQKAQSLSEEIARIRRDIHRYPELAFKEVRTAALVADTLREIGGITVRTGVGKTGVVGVLGSVLRDREERHLTLQVRPAAAGAGRPAGGVRGARKEVEDGVAVATVEFVNRHGWLRGAGRACPYYRFPGWKSTPGRLAEELP